MEALVIASLLYLATQIRDKVSAAISERFGKVAGDACGRLLDSVKSRTRDDERARKVLEGFESRPRDISQLSELRRQINRLRKDDKDFDRRLTELTAELREASDALWEALAQVARQLEEGRSPDLVGLGLIPSHTESPVPVLPDVPGVIDAVHAATGIGAVKEQLQAIAVQLQAGYFDTLVETLTQTQHQMHGILDGTATDGTGTQVLDAIDATAHQAAELRGLVYVLLGAIKGYNDSH